MYFLTKEEDFKYGQGAEALYFYADWMPWHKKMLSMIQKIENQYGVRCIAIDADSFKPLCKRFKIEAVPTVCILKDGAQLKKIVGITLFSAFKSAFLSAF